MSQRSLAPSLEWAGEEQRMNHAHFIELALPMMHSVVDQRPMPAHWSAM